MKLDQMLADIPPDPPGPQNPTPEVPGQMTVEEAHTPNGTSIHYQWAPKRLYRLKWDGDENDFDNRWGERALDWQEVPSVTTVLNVLDKSGALTWWGQGVGALGVCELYAKNELVIGRYPGTGEARLGINLSANEFCLPSVQQLNELLTKHHLSVNHVKDRAADRGVNVHDALESWCRHGVLPITEQYPEAERGYIEGLCSFLTAIQHVAEVDGMEVMVGSLEYLYAGRFDLVLNISSPVEVVTRCYPKRADKLETIPAGRFLLDLKTSKRVYPTHFLQLEAYEQASVECGYAPTDKRGVVHVTADGKYELVLNNEWCFEDFLAVRKVYTVMNERDQLAKEREIENSLRAELGAKDAA